MPAVRKGMIVMYELPSLHGSINGSRLHPAIVTAVFPGPHEFVNLRVFADNDLVPMWRGSVPHGDLDHPDPHAGRWDFLDGGSPSNAA